MVVMLRALPAITGNEIAFGDAIGALLRAKPRMERIQIPRLHAPATLAVQGVRDNERIRARLGPREGGPGGGHAHIRRRERLIGPPRARWPSERSADRAL